MPSLSIDLFTKSPDNYILQLETVNGKSKLSMHKKGIWTWLKINVGSLLGLFNKDTVKLKEIADWVFAHKNEYNANFCKALDGKIASWNIKHNPSVKVSNIDPEFTKSEFQVNNTGNFSKWINMGTVSVSNDFIRILPRKLFSSVYTRIDKSEILKHNFSNYANHPSKGSISTVSLEPSYIRESLKYPNLKDIVLYLNGESSIGAVEMKKLASLGFNTDILFYRDHRNNVHVKVNFRSMNSAS